ncbi:hypothetical protein Tco_0763700 [Tanacetum coccineum]
MQYALKLLILEIGVATTAFIDLRMQYSSGKSALACAIISALTCTPLLLHQLADVGLMWEGQNTFATCAMIWSKISQLLMMLRYGKRNGAEQAANYQLGQPMGTDFGRDNKNIARGTCTNVIMIRKRYVSAVTTRSGTSSEEHMQQRELEANAREQARERE